eukprot:GILJ01000564.1.p1 GENE.GILJ01000564.1~~GILJ01000564.1.p1  ORF type:complete len:804 (-),score=157.42 GILJ01000564.1:166-2343(-)
MKPNDKLYVVLTGRPVNLKHEWHPWVLSNPYGKPPVTMMWWKKKEESKTCVYQKGALTNAADRELDLYGWDSTAAQQKLVQQDAARRFRNYLVKKLSIKSSNLVIIDGGIAHDSPLVDEFHARDFFFDRPDLIEDQRDIIDTLCNEYGWLMRFRYKPALDYCGEWRKAAEKEEEAAGSRVLAPFEYFLLMESYNWLTTDTETHEVAQEEQETEEDDLEPHEAEEDDQETLEEDPEAPEDNEEPVPQPQDDTSSIQSLKSYAKVWGLKPNSDLVHVIAADIAGVEVGEVDAESIHTVKTELIGKITKAQFQEYIASSCPEPFKKTVADMPDASFSAATPIYRYIGVCSGLEKALKNSETIEEEVSAAITKSHTVTNTDLVDISELRDAIRAADKTVVVLGGPATGVSKLIEGEDEAFTKKISEIHGMWGAYLVGKVAHSDFGTTFFPNQFNVYADLPAAQRMTKQLRSSAEWFLAPTETCKDKAFHLWNAAKQWGASDFAKHQADSPYMYDLGVLWTAIKPTDPWVPFDFVPAITAHPELRHIFKWYDVLVRSGEPKNEGEQHRYELCPVQFDSRRTTDGKCWAPQYCPCDERKVYADDFEPFTAHALGANLPFEKVTLKGEDEEVEELNVADMPVATEAIPKAAQECSFALLMFALNENGPAPEFDLADDKFTACQKPVPSTPEPETSTPEPEASTSESEEPQKRKKKNTKKNRRRQRRLRQQQP